MDLAAGERLVLCHWAGAFCLIGADVYDMGVSACQFAGRFFLMYSEILFHVIFGWAFGMKSWRLHHGWAVHSLLPVRSC